jgi:GT2 family glycosyltransferase
VTPEISVVIVNWNGSQILPRCLDSLFHQTFHNIEVIVVDNGSTDGSREIMDPLRNAFLGAGIPFELIGLEENMGFAAANNHGAAQARGKWLALLNNDAFPEPDWLKSLLEAANQNPQFTFFASQIVADQDGYPPDSLGDILHISGMAWHRGRNQANKSLSQQSIEVFSPCAAAAMYDRQAFLMVGGFQERFFSHHEDVDLGFRLRLAGQRCLYVPGAIVRHIGSASFGVESYLTIKNGHRNLVWSYVENMPGWLFWKYLPAHLLANLFFLAFYTLRGQARPIWRAKWEAILGLPDAIRRRRWTQRNRTVSPWEISQYLDHGFLSPYLLGRHTAGLRKFIQSTPGDD